MVPSGSEDPDPSKDAVLPAMIDWVVGVTAFENPYFLEDQFFRGQAHMQLGNRVQAQTDLENYVKASSDRARVRQAKLWLKQLGRA